MGRALFEHEKKARESETISGGRISAEEELHSPLPSGVGQAAFRAGRQERPSPGLLAARREAARKREREEKEKQEKAEFLDDLARGIEKAGEYVDYIQKSIEWAQKYGGELPEGVKKAIANLSKISGHVEKFVKKFGRATEGVQLAQSIYAVADASLALDLQKPASVRAWLKAVERMNGTAKTAAGWFDVLARSSPVWARVSLLVSVLHAYITIGVEAVRSVQRAAEYREERVKTAAYKERKPLPPPAYPGDWKTAAQRREEEKEREATREAVTRQLMKPGKMVISLVKDIEARCPEVTAGYERELRRRIMAWLKEIAPWASSVDRETVVSQLVLEILEELHREVPIVPGKSYRYRIELSLPRKGAPEELISFRVSLL